MNLIYVIILWPYSAPVSSALTDIEDVFPPPLAQRPSFPLPPYFLLHSFGLSSPPLLLPISSYPSLSLLISYPPYLANPLPLPLTSRSSSTPLA